MFSSTPVLVALLSILVMLFVISNNPMWFGITGGEDEADFEQHQNHGQPQHWLTFSQDVELLDRELKRFESDLGDDLVPYRNHCLRVLIYTRFFFLSEALYDDTEKNSTLSYLMSVAAVAVAYHDIALWSDRSLAYLDPSVAQLEKYFKEDPILLDNDEKQLAIAREIILQHHKLTSYSDDAYSFSGDKTALLVINAVRKADWADFTVGLVRFGMPSSLLQVAYTKYPDAGFHRLLLQDMGPRLSPDSLIGQLDVLKIFKW